MSKYEIDKVELDTEHLSMVHPVGSRLIVITNGGMEVTFQFRTSCHAAHHSHALNVMMLDDDIANLS